MAEEGDLVKMINTRIFYGNGRNDEEAIRIIEERINKYIEKYKITRNDIINYSIFYTNPDSIFDVEVTLSYWSEK